MSGLRPLPSPVADATWERIRQATMDLVIERGYEAFSVEDIRARAGVSQAEFDARFTSLHDCLDGTYEANIAEFDQALVGPYLEAPSWREGLRAGAYGAAAHLRGHRRERRYGELRNGRGGPMELAARDRYLQRVVDLIGAGRFETGDPEAFGRATAEAALGSVYELLLKRLRETGGEDPGLAIVPELLYIVIRPYLGHEAALEELAIPPPDSAENKAAHESQGERGEAAHPAMLALVAKQQGGGADSEGRLSRLPPGRHGLPREFVSQNQRDRITAGIIAAVAERGYRDTKVSDITTAAGLSRRTFYTYFGSKDECFFATFDLIASHLREAGVAAAAPHDEWPERVRARLGAVLDIFAANPDLARFVLIAPPRAGEEIAARYRQAMDEVLAELTEGIPEELAAREPSRATEHALVGGGAALIVRKVEAGEGESLPDLLPDLVELTLAPFLGRAEAVRVARATS